MRYLRVSYLRPGRGAGRRRRRAGGGQWPAGARASGMGTSSRGCCGLIAVAAVYSLIQSITWLGLGVYTMVLRNCSVQTDTNASVYAVILIYFYNAECVPEWVFESGGAARDWVPPRTTRTDAVVLYFVVACALRAAAALALLAALVVGSRRGRGVGRAAFCFWPWAVLAGGCLVGDLACAIVFGTDLSDSGNLWTLLGLDVPENHPNSSAEYWALPAVPIFMAVACLRFGILWIAEAIMLPVAVRAFLKDRTEEKWLAKSPSASGPGRSTPPVAAPWVTAGGGGDVVRRPGGGGRSPHGPDYQEINAPALEYLSVPADSQAWGGVRPRDPNWRDGGGGAPGGGLDRWNREGSGAGGGQPSRRHAPPPPLQLPQQTRDSTGSQPVQPSPARMGAWDPRSPLPAPGAQPPFFGAPPPTHTSFGHQPPQQQQQQQQHAPFRPSAQPPRALPVAVPTVPGPGPPSPSPSPSPSPEAGEAEAGEAERRYVERLKDHDAERRRRDARKEAERRRRLQEEERQERDRALQEVQERAEERRRRRAEAQSEAAARRAGPPVAPKPRIAELQNQRLWSYVLPPRDNLPERRPSPADFPDEDYDSDDGEKPPVPVPDYTLHFHRPSDRPALASARD